MGAKRNLVVIGNGMSGARTVEEILARGGAELFNIAMFGAEPYRQLQPHHALRSARRVSSGRRNLSQPTRMV